MTPQFTNVTILMEGALFPDINLHETLNIYTKVCNVVLSIYKTDLDAIKQICTSFPNVVIIENDINEYKSQPVRIDPEFKNHTAISLLLGYCQICSVKKGLEYIDTPYVVKTKIDHCYGNICEFIQYGLTTNKIIASSLFQRGCQDKSIPNRSRYCLTDTLFMGKTSDIKLCFDLCYENRLLTRIATGIWTPYFIHIFKNKGIDINDVDDESYAKYMGEVVDIYCVNKLGSYKFKYFNNVMTYMYDNDKTTYEYLMYGCDC
jgi:hypothetical protein